MRLLPTALRNADLLSAPAQKREGGERWHSAFPKNENAICIPRAANAQLAAGSQYAVRLPQDVVTLFYAFLTLDYKIDRPSSCLVDFCRHLEAPHRP